MKRVDNIIQAINDPALFRPFFRDLSTWASWISFLKTLFGLPMDDQELAIYQQATGRSLPPSHPFLEAWLPIGRRSGKSYIAALIGVYLSLFRDYTPFVSVGERIHIIILAADRAQAQVIFKYVKGFLNSNTMFREMILNEKTESIQLINQVTISVFTSSYKAVRGFTAAAIIADEVAFWKSDTGQNPATEVLRALRPSLATIPDSLLLCISSPYSQSGPLWDVFSKHHGNDGSDILTWQASSQTMNPTLSKAVIDRAMTLDPESAKAEWLGLFRSDLQSYLPEEAILAVTYSERYELPPIPGVKYSSFVDSSGGRRDAAALAIAHVDQDRIIVDLARRWPSPHDPGQVVSDQAGILKPYRITRITADRYAGAYPEVEFLKHGIINEPSQKDKSTLYLDFIPMVLSGKVELLDNKQLLGELRGLERRVRMGSKDLVDHGPMGSDDVANVVAGVCVGIMAKTQTQAVIVPSFGIFLGDRNDDKPVEKKQELPEEFLWIKKYSR